MLFLLLGLGILVASAVSWIRILLDPDFSDAILQDGLLSFCWNSIMVLLQQPEFLISTPSMAIPLLVAIVGPFIGIPLTGMGSVALWQLPKEIEVQDRVRGSSREKVFRTLNPVAERTSAVEEEKQHRAKPIHSKPDVSVEDQMEEKQASSAVPVESGVERKVVGIGAVLTGAVTALGAMMSGLASRMRQEVSLVTERGAEKRAAEIVAREETDRAVSVASSSAAREKESEDDEQPLPDRIMAWYAAWVTVRAGQRPPRMLEEARRLAAELNTETRSAMTGFGMRGATALSMLESAAAAGMMRGMEEESVLPLPKTDVKPASDPNIDEFMREVEMPEAYEDISQRGGEMSREAEGPVLIEDDISSPAPSSSTVYYPSEETGPIVIEDDIERPNIDRRSSKITEEMTSHRQMGDGGRMEISIPIEESEFLPAPGTVEPSGSEVVTTATTGWDEIEGSTPTTEMGYSEGRVTAPEELVSEAEIENFLGAADEVDLSAKPVVQAKAEAQDKTVVKKESVEDRERLPGSGSLTEQEALEKTLLITEDGWPAMPDNVEVVSSSDAASQVDQMKSDVIATEASTEGDLTTELARSEQTRLEKVAAGSVILAQTEASGPEVEAGSESVDRDNMLETFPSGVAPEAQEAVIGPMLADPRRRATILGEREGTPAWTLRRLELYGLLGLSDKSNTAVVRMWEALDRLVSHQAQVFAWESLKETPPPAFATPEQRAAHVVNLAREVVAERARVGADLLSELRSLKAGTEHVAWMDDRVDSLLAAMTSPKVMEQLGDFLPKPEEGKVQAGGRLLKVMTGRKEPEASVLIEPSYEDLLAASHEIHQRYKEICKGLMVPLYRSLSVKVKEEDGRPAYAQIELVIGDVASTKQRSAVQEGAIGIIFALVPSGRWQIAEAGGRGGQDRLVLEGVGENAGRLLRVRDRSLDIFRRWVEGRNMRAFGVVHLLCEEGTVVDGIDRRWGDVEFVRNPWGQKDLEAIQKGRLRPKPE